MLEYSQQLQDQSTQQSGPDLQQPRSDLQPTNQNVQQGQQADPQSQGRMSQDQMMGRLQVQGVESLQFSSRPMHTNQYGWLWLLLIPLILVIVMVKLMRDAGKVARGRDYLSGHDVEVEKLGESAVSSIVAAETVAMPEATKQKPKISTAAKPKGKHKKKKR